MRQSLSFHSSIGRKQWVAISGIALMGFLIAHLSGNLILYGGQDAFNNYGVNMEKLGPLLWVMRAGLLFFFLIHVYLAIQINLENKAARGSAYQKRNYRRASFQSRTMLFTGLLLLVFICYHLAHFTFHWVNFTGPHVDALGRRDIYTMAVLGFQNPPIAISYILAMLVLSLHLCHGFSSVFQTFGVNRTQWGKKLDCAGIAFATIIFVGFSSIPVSVWLGVIQLPGGTP